MEDSQIWQQKFYYVKNEDVLAIWRTWRHASLKEKRSVEDLLIKKLSYLVYKRIQGYKNKPFYEELIQEGRLGLLKAVHQFNPDKGPNFFKFAIWKIQTNINKYMSWREKCQKEVNAFNENTSPSLEMTDPYENYEEYQRHRILLEALKGLPEMPRTVVTMRFGLEDGEPHTLQQVGDVFSLSRQRIKQIQTWALSSLRTNINVIEIK